MSGEGEARRKRVVVPAARGMSRPAPIFKLFSEWLNEPLPIVRLEIIRILTPLAVLGFMSKRFVHADEWLGEAGFRVPDLERSDWRQPFYIPPLPNWGAWLLAIVMVVSGLATAAGYKTRKSALVFALTLGFVALSDRLAAFTVSKMSPIVMLALALSASGSRLSVDYFLARKKDPSIEPPTHTTGGVRFFQVFLPVMYCGSGIAKAKGDWLSDRFVLWSHLHDTYQTPVTYWLAASLPAFAWTAFQVVTLVFEVGAPVWFIWKRTRTIALVVGVGMHLSIGLMFGPVKYFAMLMGSLLLGAYLPDEVIAAIEGFADRFERPPPSPVSDAASAQKPRKKKRKKRPPNEAATV